ILPCATATAESRSEHWAPAPCEMTSVLSGLRLLVVDDDLDSREVLASLLALRGAEARSAGNAQEAIAIFSGWTPDLLISDIGMPGEDGYDLIRRVRAIEVDDGRRTPAIALTGYATREDGERAISAGYQLHFAKPVDPSALVRAIARLVRQNGKLTDT